MFVTEGARKNLLKDERQRFIDKEWPRIAATIERLGLDVDALVAGVNQPDSSKKGADDD
jgi:GntR family transcriptional regulator